MQMNWVRPSERVRELIRQGAQLAVSGSKELLAKLDEATLSSPYMRKIADDPVLAEAIRRCNRSNQLHWVAANISHPGEQVPPNVGAESLVVVRYLIRRGMDESAVVDLYRIGQNVAWRGWMRTVSGLTADVGEQQELLDVSARSISLFIDETIAGIYQQMQAERDDLTRGTNADRRQVVALILDGAPIAQQHAEDRLGYQLGQHHTGAVVWSDESSTDLSDLDRATDALLRTASGPRPLAVPASAATRWVWLPGAAGPNLSDIATEVAQLPAVRIAVGPTAVGVEGFRRSHLDAINTQRMMARLSSVQRVVSYNDVELIALITADPERADRFVKHTLGDFANADVELQQAVLTFVHEQCNASRAAGRLFTHRNTLLRRIARANELLPQPLERASVHIAMALETLSWRGA